MQELFSTTFSGRYPMNTLEREAGVFFHTYKRIPLEIDHGEGTYLHARDGKRYLDLFSGLGVNALGYAHPKILHAIQEQSSKFIHLSNYFLQEPQIKLAEMILRYSGYSKVFLTNSGTEAIEGALKLARKWGAANGKNQFVSFSNSFHGRTMGALSLMDRPKYRDGYEPFLPDFIVIPHNDVNALRAAVNDKTAAIVLEFIQGEGGIKLASPELAEELHRLQQQFGVTIIADEIQSGLGRTGKFFGFHHYDVRPDIVTIAKPLGGGLPLGAFLGNERVAEVLQPGVHGTTFGGNPVACAAGIIVLEELMQHGLMQHAAVMGDYFRSRLLDLKTEFPLVVKEVRGFGLMIGMELTIECESVVHQLRERGILVNCTEQTVLRFLPPLIIRKEQIDHGVEVLRSVLQEMVAG
jgi:acetylornithine aminotransferase